MSDFVPAVDDGTIQRLIDRDYVDGVSGRVRTLLESYGGKPHHVERDRVRAAVLRLANGDLAEVQRQIAVANVDFRDVIGAAEFPSQMKLGFAGMARIEAERLQELREQDWKDYCAWLDRD